MKLKLKGKILVLSLFPMILLGISMFLVAADRIANSIYEEAYVGMQATTLAVRDIFEIGYDGPYTMDKNGELWKGEDLNISQAYEIVDQIKNHTGMEVTIFWNDTRILTSITDQNGERQVGTTASPSIVQQVLEEEHSYQNRNVEILGTNYVVYYAPFYQEGTHEPVGMIFLGTPQITITKIINQTRLQLLLLILAGILFATVIVFFMVNNITLALKKNMNYLSAIAQGNLNLFIENRLLKRSDEIGDLGQTQQKAKVLESVRTNTIAIVQNSSSISEENSASVEEIMAEIETINTDISHISEKASRLNDLSKDMEQRIQIFAITECAD